MSRACELYVLMLYITKERLSPDFPVTTFTEYQPKRTNSRTASNLNFEHHRSTPLHSSPLSLGVDL